MGDADRCRAGGRQACVGPDAEPGRAGQPARCDTARGAPALENLILNAYDSINFYGGATLDTRDPAKGRSSLHNLVIGTPAIYGYGGAGDVAAIRSRA